VRLRPLAFATFLGGGYGLALAALALVVFGAYDSYPFYTRFFPSLKFVFRIMCIAEFTGFIRPVWLATVLKRVTSQTRIPRICSG